MTVDSVTGLVLTVDALSGEDAEGLQEWREPIVRSVGAEVLVTDDADAFKEVADELGVAHQGCKAHVKRKWMAATMPRNGLSAGGSRNGIAVCGATSERSLL